MRLLITDEHVIFREFLKSFLSSIPKFQVAGEASDGLEAVELDAWLKPDLASADVRCHGWTDLIGEAYYRATTRRHRDSRAKDAPVWGTLAAVRQE